MIQAQSVPSISGEILIFWEFGKPDETIAAIVKHPNGKPYLFVASPEDRRMDPNFDEYAFRNTLRTYLSESELEALWIEYELPDGTQEGEELIQCPACQSYFVAKRSHYLPRQTDFSELTTVGQLTFLWEYFGHDC